MPRSALNNWSSLRRLEFIDDLLTHQGHFQRDDICRQFSCDKSTASFDIAEYRKRGGMFQQQVGDMVDGVVHPRGFKSGGKAWFVRDGDPLWPHPDRHKAWRWLDNGADNNKHWLIHAMEDWADDNPDATADELRDYFGVTATEANRIIQGERHPSDPERQWIWGIWR